MKKIILRILAKFIFWKKKKSFHLKTWSLMEFKRRRFLCKYKIKTLHKKTCSTCAFSTIFQLKLTCYFRNQVLVIVQNENSCDHYKRAGSFQKSRHFIFLQFRFSLKRKKPEAFFLNHNSMLKNKWELPAKLNRECSKILKTIEHSAVEREEIHALHDRQLGIIIVLVILYMTVMVSLIDWL